MHTYTQILYQVVFTPKYRQPVLIKEHRRRLFDYIWGIMQKKRCKLYRINGVDDHIHLLFSLHPSVSLASLIKDIKLSSSLFIKENQLFPGFKNWQRGYSAFTYAIEAKPNLVNYIKNQEAHHARQSVVAELMALHREHELIWDPSVLD
jgi:putative transposase